MFTPVLIGFAIAAVAITVGWRPWSGRVEQSAGAVIAQAGPATGPWFVALGAAAIALAIYTSHSQGNLPPWPPERWQALLWCTLPLVPISVLGHARPRLACVGFALLAGAGLWLALGPYRKHQWADSAQIWIWWPALVAAVTLVYVLLNRRAQQHPHAFEMPWLGVVLMAGAAKPIADGGSSTAALILAGLCFLAGGIGVLGLWRRDYPVLRGLAGPLAFVPFALIFQANFYAYLERLPALLLILALAAIGLPGGAKGLIAVRVALVVGCVVGANYLAWPEANPYGY